MVVDTASDMTLKCTPLIILCWQIIVSECFQLTNDNFGSFRRRRYTGEPEISCLLPSHPENGNWSVVVGEANARQRVSINTVLKYQCKPGYKLLSESPYVVCDENWDLSKLPKCEKLCPPMYSTPTTILKCVNNQGIEINCHEATDGSVLSYTCAPFYETLHRIKKTIPCRRGDWIYSKPICQPVCGRKVNDDAIPLVFGGKKQKGLEYPWIVAIFLKSDNNYKNVCGGSLISQGMVLTAAHCITNVYGDALPRENYIIGAGKFYSKFNDSRDTEAQYSEISRAVIHSEYRGDIRQFLADIAVLVLQKPFKLTYLVQPVCFHDKNIDVYAGITGVVSGWGAKEDGLPSEELRVLEIPYKSETICNQELSKEWADKYNTIDKFCAGFFNQSMSVCRGDSGNGFVIKNLDDSRYYIQGIVSLAPVENDTCNIQQNSLYTNVTNYYGFINGELGENSVDDCTLPQYPPNGKWIINESDEYPDSKVSPDTVLTIICNKGYVLSSVTSDIQCQEAIYNMPTCRLKPTSISSRIIAATCPPIIFPPSATRTCSNQNGAPIDCAKAVDNTVLSFSCPNGFRSHGVQSGTSKCVGGVWEEPVPDCQGIFNHTKPSTKVVCTYVSWEALREVHPENLNASLCDYVVFAFANLSADGKLWVPKQRSLSVLTSWDYNMTIEGLYSQMTDMKMKNRNLKVLLNVGGPGATSALFSSMAADPSRRSAFIESAKSFLKTFNFDGLDIEWHIPAPEDKENYITLLREVKHAFKQHGWILSASVGSDPDSTGYDGPKMNEILDWITVKTYDMYGDWSQYTGQNSALYPSTVENDWEKRHLNIDAAVKNWLAAGVTKKKLVVSIAFYGRSFTLKDKTQNVIHSPIQGVGPGKAGVLKYSEICDKYANWIRRWDQEQSNPYKYFEDKWIGYDDQESVRLKAAYIRDNYFFGVNVWPVNGDDVHGTCGTKQILLKEVHRASKDKENNFKDLEDILKTYRGYISKDQQKQFRMVIDRMNSYFS